MSRGISTQQRRILDSLGTDKAKSIGELVWATDTAPTPARVESVRRAVKNLEQRGLVRTGMASRARGDGVDCLYCWRADVPLSDVFVYWGEPLDAVMRSTDFCVSGRTVEQAIRNVLQDEDSRRRGGVMMGRLSHTVRRAVWPGYGTLAEYPAFRRAIDRMVKRGEIRVEWVYDTRAQRHFKRVLSVGLTKEKQDTPTLNKVGNEHR